MNRDVKVSVLMLAYNQQQYVDEAIRSVVLQETDFDYELIIGDDGSSDATALCTFDTGHMVPLPDACLQ